jgi:DNA-binding PadR family transcriptional regulator
MNTEKALSKDLVAASATPIVLSILLRGQSYGYAIIKEVKEQSDGQMRWKDGMLYPVLHRLEKQGLIESEVHPSEQGRLRKYYRLKEEGRRALTEQKEQWHAVYSILTKIWEKEACLT